MNRMCCKREYVLSLLPGNTSYQIEPKPVMGMDGVPIAQIAAGGWHSLALTGDGKVGYRPS